MYTWKWRLLVLVTEEVTVMCFHGDREKDKGRDKELREKEVRIKEEPRDPKTKHRDRRDDQQVAPAHHDDRGHDDSRKEKFVTRSHSSDERESERDSERMAAGHGHRRSAEPSPKHIDERGVCQDCFPLENLPCYRG